MTTIHIETDRFFVDGTPTYAGCHFRDEPIEGLLLNSRMIQATFDDEPGDRASLGLSRLGDLGRSAKCGGVHRGPAHLPRPRIAGGDAQLSGRLSGGLQQGTALPAICWPATTYPHPSIRCGLRAAIPLLEVSGRGLPISAPAAICERLNSRWCSPNGWPMR